MKKPPHKEFTMALAETILAQYGYDLSSLLLVFPSRRAGVFFQQALANSITRPLFAPNITTIKELSSSLASLIPGESFTLATHLYDEMKRFYTEELKKPFIDGEINTPETRIEQAQKLLKDFNDVDNYCLPADKIFQNISQLEELTSLDFLSDKQREVIMSFWKVVLTPQKTDENSTDSNPQIKEKYRTFMEGLPRLYQHYKTRLLEERIGYEGMITRLAGELGEQALKERIKRVFPAVDHIIFAGLYAITPAEKKMIQAIVASFSLEKVSFFWEGWTEEVASKDLLSPELMELFTNQLETNRSLFGGIVLSPSSSLTPPRVEHLELSSLTAGRKLVGGIIEQLLAEDQTAIDELRTAVVLPDESSLPSLISSLSRLAIPLNITMGYSLSQSYIALWFRLLIDFYASAEGEEGEMRYAGKKLQQLIHHPFSRLLLTDEEINSLKGLQSYALPYLSPDEIASKTATTPSAFWRHLATPPQDAKQMLVILLEIVPLFAERISETKKEVQEELTDDHKVQLELLKRYKEVVTSLMNSLTILHEDFEVATIAKILLSLIEVVTVPFEGEPLEGLQVMGLLESRLLAFDYLIVPEANEKKLPRSYSSYDSYIPYTLRIGYGLPTYKEREAIEAYHLFRLVLASQRTIFISGSVEEIEPSRFILQLEHLSQLEVSRSQILLPEAVFQASELSVAKTPEVLKKLERYLTSSSEGRILSPSALNTYASCPLRFYYRYVRDISEITADDSLLTPIDLGDVVHKTMEALYDSYNGGATISPQIIEQLWDNVQPTTEAIYKETLFKGRKGYEQLEGIHKIYADMAVSYIFAILQHDKTLGNFQYIAAEKEIQFSFPFAQGKEVRIKGYIDRVDIVGDADQKRLRIIDYKTGSDKLELSKWDEIFPTKAQENGNETRAITPKKAIAQLLLYSYYWANHVSSELPIEPTLYLVRDMAKDPKTYCGAIVKASDKKKKKDTPLEPIRIESSSGYKEEFEKRLCAILEEIFNPEKPFEATSDSFRCSFCSFASLCNK